MSVTFNGNIADSIVIAVIGHLGGDLNLRQDVLEIERNDTS